MGCGSSVSRLPDSSKSKGSQTNGQSSRPGSAQPKPATQEPDPEPSQQSVTKAAGSQSAPEAPRPSTSGLQPPLRPASAAAAAPASASASASASGRRPTAGAAGAVEDESQAEARQRAEDLTRILGKLRDEQEGAEEGEGAPAAARKKAAGAGDDDGGGSSGFGAEIESLLGGLDHFPDLLKELLAAPTQVLLPGNANPEDAAALQAVSGCTSDQAVRLLDCIAVIRAAADALGDDAGREPAAAAAGGGAIAADGEAKEAEPDAAGGGGDAVGGAGRGAGAGSGANLTPSPQQLTRQLGAMSGLVNDYPGLRTAAMARGAPEALLKILVRHTERAAAANSALVLSALAAGPPPHKTALIAAGAVEGLLRAVHGETAAAAANGGDAPGVAANACSAVGNLVTNHAAGAAAVAAGGGVKTLLGLLAVENVPNVRTNAAGVLVQLTAIHESYRAAIVAAGGVAALAAGMLRGPDPPACNAVTALYNLAALTPPNLRAAMAKAEGPLAIVPQLLLCMAGRNKTGAADESVAASASARVNASAVLLELCKDPTAAPMLATERLNVPSALAALAAGRLPPPPPTADAGDVLADGVELLYPVPPVVRGNCLMSLMAMARMGPQLQLELGRCGALGTLLELLAPGQDSAMQVNSANAICSLAAANSDILGALVAAKCVPLMAGLLLEGGDAARANVCAVFVTMMGDPEARQQLQECGGLTSLIRMTAAVLDSRSVDVAEAEATGGSGTPVDTGGVLCNAVGTLAEAAKHPELRRALMQVEFGESLSTLLRCVREKGTPEPAQVNAAAALCHLCREQPAAVQLGRLQGVEVLKEVVATGEAGGPGAPSSRLTHNASRALARLQDQLAEAAAAAAAAAATRASDNAAASAAATAAAAAASARETGSAADGDADADAGRPGPGSRPPLAVWDSAGSAGASAGRRPTSAASAASTAASAASITTRKTSYDDDDVDEVSTVIRPPMPLAAF